VRDDDESSSTLRSSESRSAPSRSLRVQAAIHEDVQVADEEIKRVGADAALAVKVDEFILVKVMESPQASTSSPFRQPPARARVRGPARNALPFRLDRAARPDWMGPPPPPMRNISSSSSALLPCLHIGMTVIAPARATWPDCHRRRLMVMIYAGGHISGAH